MKILLTAPLLLLFAISVSAEPLPVIPGIPFELSPGQSAEVVGGDLYFVFLEILSDSRCPLGAVCFWEGDAEAAVRGDLPGEIQIDCTLHTSPMFSQSCLMGSTVVYLLGVSPYPVLNGPPIDPADYRATFMVMPSGPVDWEPQAWGTIKALYR